MEASDRPDFTPASSPIFTPTLTAIYPLPFHHFTWLIAIYAIEV